MVTGATGILGREITFALGNDCRWSKVHALSRSQKEKYPPSVEHSHINLTADANTVAKQLKEQDVDGDYLFFAAYLAKADEGKASDVNGMIQFPAGWLDITSPSSLKNRCPRAKRLSHSVIFQVCTELTYPYAQCSRTSWTPCTSTTPS